MADYTWYTEGRAAVTRGSTSIAGTGTFWLTGARAGDIFVTLVDGQYGPLHQIDTIIANGSLTLRTAYAGDTDTDAQYAIIRNFTGVWSTSADLARQMQDTLDEWRRLVQTNFRGEKGDTGDAGTSLLIGPGTPDATLGNNGDAYINVTTFDVYHKEAGTWIVRGNIKGATGAAGKDGTLWYFGETPALSVGNIGDFNFNPVTYDVHRRGQTSWGLAANIKGATGATGAIGATGATGAKGDAARWLAGNGIPAASLGSDNEMYLDRDTGDAYRKSSGIWTLQANLKGPTGAQGVTGIPGIAYQGAWSASKTYYYRDAVNYLGSAWIAKIENIGVAPPSSAGTPETEAWVLLVAKGADGLGSGDMLQATYDADGDGVVDHARAADTATTSTSAVSAGEVPWAGVKGVPDAAPDIKGIIRIATEVEAQAGIISSAAVTPLALASKINAIPAAALTPDDISGIRIAGASAENPVVTASDLASINVDLSIDTGLVIESAEDETDLFSVAALFTDVEKEIAVGDKIKVNGKVLTILSIVEDDDVVLILVDAAEIQAADVGAAIARVLPDAIVPRIEAPSTETGPVDSGIGFTVVTGELGYADSRLPAAAEGTLEYVDGLGLFIFDPSSSDPVDGETCILPESGAGRWRLALPHFDVLANMTRRDRDYVYDVLPSLRTIMLTATAAVTWPAVAANTMKTTTFSVAGAAMGDPVVVIFPSTGNPHNYFTFTAFVSAADTVTLTCANTTGSQATPAAGTWGVAVLKMEG